MIRDAIPPEALLSGYPEPIGDLAQLLRQIVHRAVPDAVEAVRTGWRVIGYDVPVGRRSSLFAWVMPEPKHVHLGFPQGILLADPKRVLDGAGITKRARWLTLTPGDRVVVELFAGFAIEAARVARLSRSEREAIKFEREQQRSN